MKPGDGETWRFVDQDGPDEILAMGSLVNGRWVCSAHDAANQVFGL